MPRPNQRRRVALLIESSRAYGRGLLQGIAKYVREHESWTISFEEWSWSQVPAWLADWEGDGLIARIETRELAEVICKLDIPTVDLRGSVPDLGLPLIDTDDQAVSALAAEHLWERGFRHFAFCGFVGANYSDTRSQWFHEHVGQLGGDCSANLPPPHTLASSTIELEKRGLHFQADLARWLVELPRPIGIMACNDIRGQQVMRACRQLGLLVPDEVGVAALSRTVLERRFTRLVGCSPKAELLRVQLARARQLLTETDLPLAVIAERSGFKHPAYFNVIFKLKIGLTPGRYRQQNQSKTS